ncbi:MAG: M20/M25/M40 family metallo-hydrolase [Candidatus Aminicenantes bacterium]|nr:M20/M25/M40 family metallo-hydrolase [Candidatus Aminicenantes bacterium]
MKRFLLYGMALVIMAVGALGGAGQEPLWKKVREYRRAHEAEILREFRELLSVPNVASDGENIRANAELLRRMMEKRGLEARVMETAGNPVVFAQKIVPGAGRTLLFYAHYDGQPVEPGKWTGTAPFEPALRPGKLRAGTREPGPIPFPAAGARHEDDWRLYARSASDDKAPIICFLAALDALRESGFVPRNNIKIILDGEEEAGSTNLFPFLEKNKDLLGSDVLFMCDGPAYYSGDPTLFFGARGITTLEVTVYGPDTSLHSGHYGNWAPNPAVMLAHLLASMRDANGRVKVAGFYDTVVPLGESELRAVRSIPSHEEEIKRTYGFRRHEDAWPSLMEAIQYPAININGLESGAVGSRATTSIPASAAARLDIRLVKGNDPRDMAAKVVSHIRAQGYHVVEGEPDDAARARFPMIARVTGGRGGYAASRTAMDLPVCRAAVAALSRHGSRPPVLLPTLGGSLPIVHFQELLETPIVGVSVVNHDNNQHQHDENVRLGHLWLGIETLAALLMMD